MARIHVEQIKIPTYSVGQPEPSPLFLERRINQGATGCVYPYPFVDVIKDDKTDVEYEAVFLENEYLKIMVLPELGGRIQMAYDKIASRHFVYHNTVIKPALIGLLGPWISGGIEFNWPMHHRPTTYQRLDYTIVENPDGSKTLWVGEQEKIFHTRCSVGYTIYPERAYLKLSVMIYNGTDLPQIFLWWTNIAVRSDKDHQHVFPPDVDSVHFHAKSDCGRYPVMTGKYCGVDFSEGVDISRNTNIPFAVSYMATPSKYSFSGAYSHEENAGILHIADAGISPGKKLFTWGNEECDFARGWMRNLTDSDGPYLELMAGVFTDNQPDFAWLSPGEEKRFDEYIVPYNNLGIVKNANEKAAIQCEIHEGNLDIALYVTAPLNSSHLSVMLGSEILCSETISLNPEHNYSQQVRLPQSFKCRDISVFLRDEENNVILNWQGEEKRKEPLPDVKSQVKQPQDIGSNDELFLTAVHIEQYLHASYLPEDYYLEALRRDRTDCRCNLGMGRLMLRRGNFRDGMEYLQTAWEKYTIWNFNPYDGEISFLLGLCSEYLGDHTSAYQHYYKSVWNGPWQAVGYMALARLECRKENYCKAAEFIERSLAVNGINRKARHLAAAIMRKQGKKKQAVEWIEKWLTEDPIDYWMLIERYLLTEDQNALERFLEITRGENHTFLELAVDYTKYGMEADACKVLDLIEEVIDPMVYYHQAHCMRETDREYCRKYIQKAEEMPLTPCFPNRLEDIQVLKYAIDHHDGYKSNYLLGNLYYDKRQYMKAIDCWHQSLTHRKDFAGTWRNLAIGTFNKLQDRDLARQQMEKALKLEPNNARFVSELNELYINSAVDPRQRLEFLEKHIKQVRQRDDLKLEHVTAANLCRNYKEALDLTLSYRFHPWECKEGLTGDQYVISNIALGCHALAEKDYDQALSYFEKGMHLPENLGEEKLTSATDNDLKYYAGRACELNGDMEKAARFFKQALTCSTTIHPALSLATVSKSYYIFYRGLAFRKLSEDAMAAKCFNQLIEYGIENYEKEIRFEFLEIGTVTSIIFDEDLNNRNRAYCLFLQALGQLGFGNVQAAQKLFASILDIDPNHSQASLLLGLLELEPSLYN